MHAGVNGLLKQTLYICIETLKNTEILKNIAGIKMLFCEMHLLLWHGVAWCGVVWRGVAWCGVVWHGVAWCVV